MFFHKERWTTRRDVLGVNEPENVVVEVVLSRSLSNELESLSVLEGLPLLDLRKVSWRSETPHHELARAEDEDGVGRHGRLNFDRLRIVRDRRQRP